jgi:hypothetical protein
MRKMIALPMAFLIVFSIFAALPVVFSVADPSIKLEVFVTYAIPPTDDSTTNPYYELLTYNSYPDTINYYINPKNTYGFSNAAVVSTITTSVNTWDKETSYQVFSYVGTTTRAAGKYDGYNVIAWGKYRTGVIAVTMSWVSDGHTLEVDCMMNTRFKWSLTGEAGKMDVQNIMTHELGHFCGLKDLYNDADYWLTMYGYSDYGLTYARTLGLGDINGLKAVYGN